MATNPNFFKIFASNGELSRIEDDDYKGGWNDIVGDNPPSYKQFNFLGNRTDKRLKYLNQIASLEWDMEIDYVAGQIVRIGASQTLYQCKVANENKQPNLHINDGFWTVFGASPTKSLQEDGYIQLPEAMGSLLVQWKKCVESTSSTDKIAWPIPFPNAVFNVQATRILEVTHTTQEAGTIVWEADKAGFIVSAGWRFGDGKSVYVLGIGY